jgi:hypothetical protein
MNSIHQRCAVYGIHCSVSVSIKFDAALVFFTCIIIMVHFINGPIFGFFFSVSQKLPNQNCCCFCESELFSSLHSNDVVFTVILMSPPRTVSGSPSYSIDWIALVYFMCVNFDRSFFFFSTNVCSCFVIWKAK